jgi:hypothetical protein
MYLEVPFRPSWSNVRAGLAPLLHHRVDGLPITRVAVDVSDDVTLKLEKAKGLADKRTVGSETVPFHPPHIAMATTRVCQQGLATRFDLGSLGELQMLIASSIPIGLLVCRPRRRRRPVDDVDGREL